MSEGILSESVIFGCPFCAFFVETWRCNIAQSLRSSPVFRQTKKPKKQHSRNVFIALHVELDCGAAALPAARNLPAAPPGSPLAPPLIYSLIHLCCCHMASLCPPHYSLHHPHPPSVLHLFSYLRAAHLGGLSIRACPSILASHSSLRSPRRSVATGPPPHPTSSFAGAAVRRQGRRRSDLASVSD